MGTLEEKITAAETKLKQLKAEQQKVEARKKAADIKRKRQDDTRRKVVVGAVLLARVESGEWPEAEFKAMMEKALTRAEDRALFDLPVIEDVSQEAKPQTTEPAPATPT